VTLPSTSMVLYDISYVGEGYVFFPPSPDYLSSLGDLDLFCFSAVYCDAAARDASAECDFLDPFPLECAYCETLSDTTLGRGDGRPKVRYPFPPYPIIPVFTFVSPPLPPPTDESVLMPKYFSTLF